MALSGLAQQPGKSNRLSSRMNGELAQARIDETLAPHLAAEAALTTTAIIGTAILVKLVLLFARDGKAVSANPKAQRLVDLIGSQPGLPFGKLRELTGLGHGTTHYYLQRLTSAGLIVRYPFQNTMRYFENHGRYKDGWKQYAALCKPQLAAMHRWLLSHPGVTQADIIAMAQEMGLKRSAAQVKLNLLVATGLASSERDGRAFRYIARPVVPPGR